jgi:hypothetical protein
MLLVDRNHEADPPTNRLTAIGQTATLWLHAKDMYREFIRATLSLILLQAAARPLAGQT